MHSGRHGHLLGSLVRRSTEPRGRRNSRWAAADEAGKIGPTGPTSLLYPSPEEHLPGASVRVVAGNDGDLITASHATARTDKETEGPSHAPESALVAACTGKRQDADVASNLSDSDVASP